MSNQFDEESFGIIPVRKVNSKWQVLLIKHQAGHWSFPKGHLEVNETPQETAKRELFEETALQVERIMDPNPLEEQYRFRREGKNVFKRVQYFLATVKGDIKLQEKELERYDWLDLSDAKARATFPEAKKLCEKIEKRLKG